MKKRVTQLKRGDIILWEGQREEVLYAGPHEMAGGLHEVFIKDEERGERVFSIPSSESLDIVEGP